MDVMNIWSVLLDMKFAADALRSLHNDSEPEDVDAAHAEHDAAIVLFNHLVQSHKPRKPHRPQKRYVAIDLDKLNYNSDNAFTSEEEAWKYRYREDEYRLIPVTNYKFFMLFHTTDPGFKTGAEVEDWIKDHNPGRCLIGEVDCDELMLKAGE